MWLVQIVAITMTFGDLQGHSTVATLSYGIFLESRKDVN